MLQRWKGYSSFKCEYLGLFPEASKASASLGLRLMISLTAIAGQSRVTPVCGKQTPFRTPDILQHASPVTINFLNNKITYVAIRCSVASPVTFPTNVQLLYISGTTVLLVLAIFMPFAHLKRGLKVSTQQTYHNLPMILMQKTRKSIDFIIWAIPLKWLQNRHGIAY
jgi:hypothetical protein